MTFEFKVVLPDQSEVVEQWDGRTVDEAAKRLLACKYPAAKVVAWRYPSHVISTSPMRGA